MMLQRKEPVKELNKKWKNLRRCYKRKRDSPISKSGSVQKKKVQYVYFDVLSFLAPVFSMKTTHFNVGDAEDEEREMDEVPSVSQELGTDKPFQLSSASSKRKRDKKSDVADVCQLLKRSLEERMIAEKRKAEREETDDVLHFLMSLLHYTRAVKSRIKLSMRVELLQVVTKYYECTPSNFCPTKLPTTSTPTGAAHPFPSSSVFIFSCTVSLFPFLLCKTTFLYFYSHIFSPFNGSEISFCSCISGREPFIIRFGIFS